MKKSFLPVFVLIAGLALIYPVSRFLERVRPSLPENYTDQDLSLQGEKLKGFSFGAEGLIADWYWMRSLQYIGNKLANSELQNVNLDNLNALNPRLLHPLLDNATSLDKRFLAAYSYGAMVLPAIDKKKAISFLEKGIADNPEQWRLYQHLGYIYWRLKDFDKAAEVYKKGASIPGAPVFMMSMAAKMTNEGGERETARDIYRQMYNEAEDTRTKESARLRLLELESLDERDGIKMALTRFSTVNGRCVDTWKELFPYLTKIKLPSGKDYRIDRSEMIIDPTGAPYILDKKNCEAKLDVAKTKIPRS